MRQGEIASLREQTYRCLRPLGTGVYCVLGVAKSTAAGLPGRTNVLSQRRAGRARLPILVASAGGGRRAAAEDLQHICTCDNPSTADDRWAFE